MRLLWLTNEYPEFPSAAHKSWTYLAMAELGKRHSVTFVGLQGLPENSEKLLTGWGIKILAEGRRKESASNGRWFASLRHAFVRKFRRVVQKLTYPDVFYRWGQESAIRWESVLRGVSADDYDVAVLDHAGFANLLPFLPTGIARVLVMANVGIFAFDGRPKAQRPWESLWSGHCKRRIESCDAASVKNADLIVCMTEKEKNWLLERGAGPCVVLPVVTDYNYFSQPVQRWLPPKPGPWLVFTGTLSYSPNSDAMIFFCKEVLPILRAAYPEIGVLIVGMDPPESLLELSLSDDLIVVTKRVPDVRPFVAAGTVYIAPIRYGSGIKIKLMEAMSMGKAIVASPEACEGLGVTHGQQLLVASGPQEFANDIAQLLEDETLCNQLAKNASDFARLNFDYHEQIIRLENELFRISMGPNVASERLQKVKK